MLFDLVCQVTPWACYGDAALRPGLTVNPPQTRERGPGARVLPPLRSHHLVKGTAGRLPGGGGAHSQEGVLWQDGGCRPQAGIPAWTPLNIRSSEDPFDPRRTWGGPSPAWAGRSSGGGGAPQPAYLQHVSRDELLAAVTADAELGVVVSFAVRQPVPARSQLVRTAGVTPAPQDPTSGCDEGACVGTRSERCRNARWQAWRAGGDLAVHGVLGTSGPRDTRGGRGCGCAGGSRRDMG